MAGERRAEIGSPHAAAHLERAVALAGEVDSAFLAGVARHTLLTARAAAGALGPGLDVALAEGAALDDTAAVAVARRMAGVS